MQATEHWLTHDLASLRWLHCTRLRCILIERSVRTRPMIVFEEGRDDPEEVGLIQHDDVVQALPAESADPALDERILPRALRCDEYSSMPRLATHRRKTAP